MTRDKAIAELIRIWHSPHLDLSLKAGLAEAIDALEPRTDGVLCALADRECPFQGKEFAWCLTCPHISEEDRALVKKAIAEPKREECEEREQGLCPYYAG